jgi:hypothetical protein
VSQQFKESRENIKDDEKGCAVLANLEEENVAKSRGIL